VQIAHGRVIGQQVLDHDAQHVLLHERRDGRRIGHGNVDRGRVRLGLGFQIGRVESDGRRIRQGDRRKNLVLLLRRGARRCIMERRFGRALRENGLRIVRRAGREGLRHGGEGQERGRSEQANPQCRLAPITHDPSPYRNELEDEESSAFK